MQADRYDDVADQPLSILHVAAPARVGGLERVVQALASGHARAGHAVHVIAVAEQADDARPFLEPLEQVGVRGHAVVLPTRAYWREWQSIRDVCRSSGAQIVHTHGYRSDLIGGSAARSAGLPTVTTVHGFTGGGLRNRLYERLQVRAFRRFDAVVAVSQVLEDQLRHHGVPVNRLHMIPNALGATRPMLSRPEARRRLGLEADHFRLGWVGRLSREKGADVLVEALALMPEDVFASFIGDGPEAAALRALAETRGVANRVQWHGLVPDAGSLLRAMDAFVLSSRTEGTPITLLEAMSAQVPIIATAVGGVPGVVSDAEALLVPSDEPAAIAKAVLALRDDPRAAERRAVSAGIRLDQNFAAGPWLDKYLGLYRQLA